MVDTKRCHRIFRYPVAFLYLNQFNILSLNVVNKKTSNINFNKLLLLEVLF